MVKNIYIFKNILCKTKTYFDYVKYKISIMILRDRLISYTYIDKNLQKKISILNFQIKFLFYSHLYLFKKKTIK